MDDAARLKQEKKLKKQEKKLKRIEEEQQQAAAEAKKKRKEEKRKKNAEQEAAAVVETKQTPEEEAAEKKKQRKQEKKALRAQAEQEAAALATQAEATSKPKKAKKEKHDTELTNGHANGHTANGNVHANGNGHANGRHINGKATSFYTVHPEVAAWTTEEVEAFRKELNMTVSEPELRPVKTFAQAGFPSSIQSCLTKFQKPTSIQSQCWPALLQGRDVIGIAKTGSGKTLTFMLPAYVKILDAIQRGAVKNGPLCLVLAPTRELALQSAKVCEDMVKQTGIKTACIYGGGSAQQQIAALNGGARVVIGTPGRLIGLMDDGNLSLSQVFYAVLDEADRMLDMGFEADVRKIMDQVSQVRQTLLFSATWPTSVQKLGNEFVSNPFTVRVGSDQLTANHDVAQIVEVLEDATAPKDKRLLEVMKQYYNKQDKNRILVFVLYKKDVPRVEALLQRAGYGCGSISSDLTQSARIHSLECFRNGSKPVLVGTDVASRGLDIPDVSHVINYSFPLTVEDYVHRIGRTGRSGKKGVSHTFFTKFDKGLTGELVNILNEAKANVPPELLAFGTGVKRKEHSMYGAHFKDFGGAPMPASKKVVFS